MTPKTPKTPMTLPLLTAVAVLCAARPALQPLDHVGRSIDAFLDGSGRYDVVRAVSTGSRRLLQRVFVRLKQDEETDPFLREQLISKGLREAVRRRDMQAVELIHLYHPGFLAASGLSMAAAQRDFELLRWLYEHRPEERDCIAETLVIAATNGSEDIVRWILQQNEPSVICPSDALRLALVHGHVQVAEYLISKGVRAKLNAVGDVAAANGHLEAVKWLHTKNFDLAFTTEAMTAAAGAGHYNIVRFLHENRPEGCRSRAMDGAASGGYLEIVEFLFSRRREGCTARAVNGAAKNGHLHILEWLYEHYRSNASIWTSQAATNALAHGQYEVFEWLRSKLPDRSNKLPPYAALEVSKEGNLRGLQILHDIHGQEVRWSPRVMEVAAGSGDLAMVHWLYEHRSSENWMTAMDQAAENGHLRVVKYMHTRGARCSAWAMNKAAGSGHLHVVKWLHNNRSEGCTSEAMDMAAAAGHMNVVKWLHYNRTEGCTTEAIDAAASGGHLEVVIWLHKNRSEGYTEGAFTGHSNWEIVQWILHNHVDELPIQAVQEAAARGRIHTLNLLSRFGLRAGEEDIVRAAAWGHLNVVQWAYRIQHTRSEYQFFEPTRCRDEAEAHGHFHIADWLQRYSGLY